MPQSDRWTLNQLTTSAQIELTDTAAQWWTVAEIQQYITNWQAELQSQFEFCWGSATYIIPSTGTNLFNQFLWNTQQWNALATSSSTFVLADIAGDMLRLDAIYFCPGTGTWGTDTSIRRLTPRDKLDLDSLQRDWRSTGTGIHPYICYQDDTNTLSVWPPAMPGGTLIFEYPRRLEFASGTSTMQVPAWTKYDIIPYVAYKALSRFGPNQDLARAAHYRRRHDINTKRFRKVYDRYFPQGGAMLRPGRQWAGQIVNPLGRRQIGPNGSVGG